MKQPHEKAQFIFGGLFVAYGAGLMVLGMADLIGQNFIKYGVINGLVGIIVISAGLNQKKSKELNEANERIRHLEKRLR